MWAGIVGLSVGKKLTLYLLAKVYGFPKLYRKSLKGVRLFTSNKEKRETARQHISCVFRLPNTIAAKLRKQPAAPQQQTKSSFSSVQPQVSSPRIASSATPSATAPSAMDTARLALRAASRRASQHSSRALQQLQTLKSLAPRASYSFGSSPLMLGARQKLQGAREYWREQVTRQRGAMYLQYATAATSAVGSPSRHLCSSRRVGDVSALTLLPNTGIQLPVMAALSM